MTRITPNFNFDGRCADAIALYEQAFHAQVIMCCVTVTLTRRIFP